MCIGPSVSIWVSILKRDAKDVTIEFFIYFHFVSSELRYSNSKMVKSPINTINNSKNANIEEALLILDAESKFPLECGQSYSS